MSDPFEDDTRSRRKFKKNQSLVQVFFDQWSDDWVETADRLCSILALPGMCWTYSLTTSVLSDGLDNV